MDEKLYPPIHPASVRRATLEDVSALVALRVEMFRGMRVSDADSPQWQDAAGTWFAARIEDPDHGIFVVEVGGDVVASAVGSIRDAAPSPACPAGRDVLISNVCTFPGHRGSGHGSAAFAAVMAWARETGIERAELMATEGGRRIYAREGFELNRFPAMRAMLRMKDQTDLVERLSTDDDLDIDFAPVEVDPRIPEF